MRSIITFIIACYVSFTTILAQNTPTLTPAQMQEDLTYLNKYLRKWQPSFYDYTPKADMKAFYQGMKDSLTHNLNQREFGSLVREAVSKVGCGHMSVSLSPDSTRRYLPLNVWVLGGRLFVKNFNKQDSLLKAGDELLAINGVEARFFIEKAKTFFFTDGNNETYAMNNLEEYLDVFHYRLFGAQANYELKLRRKTGETLTAHVLPVLAKNLPSVKKPVLDTLNMVVNADATHLYKTNFDDKTMVLDIDGFQGKKQKRSFKKVFQILKDQKIENLVIDLRENGGGSIFKGNNLLTYLLDQTVIPFTIGHKPNLIMLNPHQKAKFGERITPLLFLMNPLQYPSRDGWSHLFPFIKKNRLHFDGKIYVLTNGGSFSMSSYVASYLKHKRGATIVGEETGGSEFASRSSAGIRLTLPNSGIKVFFNMYQTRHHVGIEDTGRGVMPNFPTTYTIEDKLNQVDVDMQVVQDLIKKQTTTSSNNKPSTRP